MAHYTGRTRSKKDLFGRQPPSFSLSQLPTNTARGVNPPRSRSATWEGAALRGRPELPDPLDALQVGEYEDVKQLSAWSRPKRVQAVTGSGSELVGPDQGLDLAWSAIAWTGCLGSGAVTTASQEPRMQATTTAGNTRKVT